MQSVSSLLKSFCAIRLISIFIKVSICLESVWQRSFVKVIGRATVAVSLVLMRWSRWQHVFTMSISLYQISNVEFEFHFMLNHSETDSATFLVESCQF